MSDPTPTRPHGSPTSRRDAHGDRRAPRPTPVEVAGGETGPVEVILLTADRLATVVDEFLPEESTVALVLERSTDGSAFDEFLSEDVLTPGHTVAVVDELPIEVEHAPSIARPRPPIARPPRRQPWRAAIAAAGLVAAGLIGMVWLRMPSRDDAATVTTERSESRALQSVSHGESAARFAARPSSSPALDSRTTVDGVEIPAARAVNALNANVASAEARSAIPAGRRVPVSSRTIARSATPRELPTNRAAVPPPRAMATAPIFVAPALPAAALALSPTVTPMSPPVLAPLTPAVMPVVNDAGAIRQTLGRYRRALSGLDAGAARAVWPSVDERALGRAFAQLQEQELQFDKCEIAVAGAAATAHCGGHARYVPRIGGRAPRTDVRQWTFNLRKVSDEWVIDAVDAR
jgi:hypothetical protein